LPAEASGYYMGSLIVAVGSIRRPKIDAVRDALDELAPRFCGNSRFEVLAVDTASGVSHTPLSREETMAGARQRAEALARIAHERQEKWQYFVGLEGGLDLVLESGGRRVFLENWTYVADCAGRGAFGRSGAVQLPEAIVQRVVDSSVELAEAIDIYAEAQGIRDAQGAWGVFTRGIITRRDAVRISVISAFSALLTATHR
jgi:non-canonical (house-cleaning) NTP pyrophosphatase